MEIGATLVDMKRYSACKSEYSEGREIPGHPRNLDIPQPVLSGAGQGFDFHVRELDIIEMDLDCFGRALRPLEDESDFRCGFSFGHIRESGELEKDPGPMYDLPFFVVARLFVPRIRTRLGFVCV